MTPPPRPHPPTPCLQPEETKQKMKNVMRFVALIVPVVSYSLPASVFMYWTGEAPRSCVALAPAGGGGGGGGG